MDEQYVSGVSQKGKGGRGQFLQVMAITAKVSIKAKDGCMTLRPKIRANSSHKPEKS